MVLSYVRLYSLVFLLIVESDPSSTEYMTCVCTMLLVSSTSTFDYRSLLIVGDAVLSNDLEFLDPECCDYDATSLRTDLAI